MSRCRTRRLAAFLLCAAGAIATFAACAAEADRPDSISGLPLIEAPARDGGRLAVIVSGAGGWASIDREIAKALVDRNVAVVGLDSPRYFWKRRTPDTAARDLEAVLRHYMAKWARNELILVGYSFGADTIPFMVARLPPDVRSRVLLVALIGLSKSATFEFRVSDWLDREQPDSLPTAPEIARLAPVPVLCVYGLDEQDAFCPQLRGSNIAVHALPGEHHFGGDYRAVAALILEGLK